MRFFRGRLARGRYRGRRTLRSLESRPSSDCEAVCVTALLNPRVHWLGLDLDDTLHYFRRASSQAAEAVFAEIDAEIGCGAQTLSESYAEILIAAQSTHFTRARSAREYRAERFR